MINVLKKGELHKFSANNPKDLTMFTVSPSGIESIITKATFAKHHPSTALVTNGSLAYLPTISIPTSFSLKSRSLSWILAKSILENKDQLSSAVRNLG